MRMARDSGAQQSNLGVSLSNRQFACLVLFVDAPHCSTKYSAANYKTLLMGLAAQSCNICHSSDNGDAYRITTWQNLQL